jgi:hypothetical protein
LIFSEFAYLFSASLAGILVIVGVMKLYNSRVQAYRWFKRSLLVSILLVQVFQFYRNQLGGFSGLLINILLLIAINYMLSQEKKDLPTM